MRYLIRSAVSTALLLIPVPLFAQAGADPSGHWEGTIQTPKTEVEIEIDIVKKSDGALGGTYSQPAQAVKGLPLSSVAVDGRTIRFALNGGDGLSTFEGTLAAEGNGISGTVRLGEFSVPFSLRRTGEARIVPAPKSAPISRNLEGTWNGALDLGTRQMRVVLRMANLPDATATGTIASPDGSGIEIPIAMTQKAATLTIDVPSVGASFTGTLNAAETELAGTWTQQASSLPLTFRRVPVR